MPLVEVVRTVTTSEETFKRAFGFAASLRKEPIAAKDTSGFIVNLLLVPYLLDAIRAVERGVGSVPDIDKAMQLGCGYPMGPLTLLDFVGLDTTHHIAEIMFKEYREARYAPPPWIMQAPELHGKKSGGLLRLLLHSTHCQQPGTLMLGYDAPRCTLYSTILASPPQPAVRGRRHKRESLMWAAIWTLWAGVIGGWRRSSRASYLT
jgi:hypothetical protein